MNIVGSIQFKLVGSFLNECLSKSKWWLIFSSAVICIEQWLEATPNFVCAPFHAFLALIQNSRKVSITMITCESHPYILWHTVTELIWISACVHKFNSSGHRNVQSISLRPRASDCLDYTSVLFSQMMLWTLMFCILLHYSIAELVHVLVEVV